MNKSITIREFESFTERLGAEGYHTLPSETFRLLEKFILSNRSEDTDALDLMGISIKRGVGKVITAKNYVGVITLRDGTTIEILPKIASDSGYASDESVKRLLIEMLVTLGEFPYKTLQTSQVDIAKQNIFEIFIEMFVDEVFRLVKRGIRGGYETKEENLGYYKGKLLFTQQIRFNFAHKERNYVAFDEFNTNRPENRLLKATLEHLYRCTTSAANKKNIKVLLSSFAEVAASTDYQADFRRYVPDRNMKDYATAIMWSKVFLQGKSFTTYSGSEAAFALLFSMNDLYESYIAALIKKHLGSKDFIVSVQDHAHYLFEETRQFALRPDIVVTKKSDGCVFVFDTKWKVLDEKKFNYGLSQADMYQMYVYHQKYHAERTILLYPKTQSVAEDELSWNSPRDQVTVQALFVDLFDVQKSMEKIDDICCTR